MEENELDITITDSDLYFAQELTLDLNSNNAYTVVSIKQADSARYLKVYLTKNNVPYEFDLRHSFYIRVRKPDGHAVVNLASAETDSNDHHYIKALISGQMARAAGRGYADIVEQDGSGNVLSTISFILNIMASPAVGDIESSDEFKALSDLIGQTQALIEHAPIVDTDPESETYLEWLQYDPDTGTKVTTGVIAKGQDGVAPRINDDEQSEFYNHWQIWNSTQQAYVDTNVVALGQDGTDGIDGTSADIHQITAQVTEDGGEPSIEVTKSGSSVARDFEFNFKNFKGPQGERGLPGLGGVSWVDGIESITEWHIKDNNWTQIGTLGANPSYNSETYTLNFGTELASSLDDINEYITVSFDTSNPSNETTNYLVTQWATNESGNVNGVIFPNTSHPSAAPSSGLNIYGKKGERSGNVRLQGISYTAQSSFITYDDSTGAQIVNEINDTMRDTARNNIKELGRNEIITYKDLQVITKQYVYTDVE